METALQILSNFAIKRYETYLTYIILLNSYSILADDHSVDQVHTVNFPSLTKAILLCLGFKFKRRYHIHCCFGC